MKIGYARVSTKDQNLDMQREALQKVGCEIIFEEKKSGKEKDNRPELKRMNAMLRKGDVVVIWKLDRLGRSLPDLIELVEFYHQSKVGLQSLHDPIDTTTSSGKLTFNIFAALAEFERSLISERTIAGLKNARKNGRIGGRPKGLSDTTLSKAREVALLYNNGYSKREIAGKLDIGRATVYRLLNHLNIK